MCQPKSISQKNISNKPYKTIMHHNLSLKKIVADVFEKSHEAETSIRKCSNTSRQILLKSN